MDFPGNISSLLIPDWILIILGFSMAICLTCFIIPSVVNISRLKNLTDTPDRRKSHTSSIPNLGGIAVFVAFVLATVIFAGTYFKFELKYIISGLIVVFFVGIKDDILIIDPYKKLAGQIFAVILIAIFADIRITNLYGLLHVQQLPYVASILLTVFVFIVIINGFNLIDGIDGLASGIGILTSSVFGIWFWMSGHIGCTILSFSFVGALAAFFCFNVFGNKNKIFLGDSGSMVIGFVMGVLACRFLQLELVTQGTVKIPSAPTVVCGVLIVPLFDSLRVFILRIVQGKSPFKADHQHIHHRLLQLGCSHLQATLVLIGVNAFFIVLSYMLRAIGIVWLMGVIVGLASLMSHFLVVFANKRRKKEIDAVISSYFAVKISQGRHKTAEIAEKQSIEIPNWNYQKNVNAGLN